MLQTKQSHVKLFFIYIYKTCTTTSLRVQSAIPIITVLQHTHTHTSQFASALYESVTTGFCWCKHSQSGHYSARHTSTCTHKETTSAKLTSTYNNGTVCLVQSPTFSVEHSPKMENVQFGTSKILMLKQLTFEEFFLFCYDKDL